jgi:hypothetical protein
MLRSVFMMFSGWWLLPVNRSMVRYTQKVPIEARRKTNDKTTAIFYTNNQPFACSAANLAGGKMRQDHQAEQQRTERISGQ